MTRAATGPAFLSAAFARAAEQGVHEWEDGSIMEEKQDLSGPSSGLFQGCYHFSPF